MNRNLPIVAASLFAWGLGEGLFFIFQPIYLEEWGADPVMIGSILGAAGIAIMIAQLPAGYLSDRFGPRPMMWASWILGTIAIFFMASANTLSMFVVGVITYGFSGFAIAPMNSYITRVRGRLSAGRALTLVSAAYNLGAVSGPLLGGWIAGRTGLRNVFWVSFGVVMVSTLLIFFIKPADVEPHEEIHARGNLFKNNRFLVLAGLAFLTVLIMYMPQPLTPNYLKNIHSLTVQQVGWLGSIASVGNVIGFLLLGNLKPGIGFLVGQPLMILFVLLIWQGTDFWMYGLGYFLLSGYRLTRTMLLATARSVIHPSDTGLAFGMMETASGLAIVAAPTIAGFLYDRSPSLVYQVGLFALLAMVIINLVAVAAIFSRKPTRKAGDS